MGKVLIVAIICFLLFGCSEESDIQYKMVVIDWEQLHDPNISVNLLEKPIYILNGEEPMKNSFEIGLRIETTEKYSEYDIIVTLFDKRGKILKTYPLHTSLELQENSWKGILSYDYSDHIPELKELNKYKDSMIYVYRFENEAGNEYFFNKSIIREFFRMKYPKVDVDEYFNTISSLQFK